jgi:hypothetical protein
MSALYEVKYCNITSVAINTRLESLAFYTYIFLCPDKFVIYISHAPCLKSLETVLFLKNRPILVMKQGRIVKVAFDATDGKTGSIIKAAVFFH